MISSQQERKPFLSASDVANLFGVDPATIYREMDAGKLPYLLIGKRRRVIEPADLDLYVKKHKVGKLAAV